MKIDLLIPTKKVKTLESECDNVGIGFKVLREAEYSTRCEVEVYDAQALFYLGAAYAYSTIKPVAFTEEEYLQNK